MKHAVPPALLSFRPRLTFWGGPAAILLGLCLSSQPARAQFGPVSTYSTGKGSVPRSLALGDVNADGRLDVVTILAGRNAIGVLTGDGSGKFPAITAYALSSGAHTNVVLADVNKDGRLDIVATNNVNSAVDVLLGQAGGAFGAFSSYSTGTNSYPQGVAVADVNADGRPDLVTANTDANTVAVLPGQAGGGFAEAEAYSTGVGTQPLGVALGDINGDGRLDIVTTNSGNGTVGVLAGQAGGKFAPIVTHPSGANGFPQSLVLSDLNTDGRLDVVLANWDNNAIGVLLAQAGGGFAAVAEYSTGAKSAPRPVAVGDVNGDGRLDIVTANSAALNDKAGVLLGQGGGKFAPIVLFSTGLGSAPRSVALGDVNGDGRPDMVTVHPGTYGAVPGSNELIGGDAIGVLLNTGTYPLAARHSSSTATVSLFPNPARSSLTVRRPAAGAAAATLLNSLGQPVRRFELLASETSLNLPGIAPGVYTLCLQVNGQPVRKRVVLE